MSADSREHRQSLELIAFIRENQERFYRMAYSYVKNQETALDLVQDAIVQALQKRHTLREPACAVKSAGKGSCSGGNRAGRKTVCSRGQRNSPEIPRWIYTLRWSSFRRR